MDQDTTVSNIENDDDTPFDDAIGRLFFKILELRGDIAGLDERLCLIELMKEGNGDDTDDNDDVVVDPREGDEGQAPGHMDTIGTRTTSLERSRAGRRVGVTHVQMGAKPAWLFYCWKFF